MPIHQRIVRRLAAQLEPQFPARWQLETDVDVLLNEEPLDYLTPDIVVFERTVPLTTRPIRAHDVVLVVEVVSRGSRRADRGSKPLAYAESGIPFYWRVENHAGGTPVTQLHVFDSRADARRGTPEYVERGVHTERFTLDAPFDVELDLDQLG